MQKRLLFVSCLLSLAITSSCQNSPNQSLPDLPPVDAFQINQAGYTASGPKRAVITGAKQTSFFLIAEAGDTVFRGKTGPEMLWDASAQWAAEADFSAVDQPGTYRLVANGIAGSANIEISGNPALDVATDMIKSLYYQRCSEALPETYAGKWARPAGHADREVEVHPSAATAARPAGTMLALPGGWYDAGDYGKYCGPTAFVTWSLLHLLELNPAFADLSLNIPESENSLPDVLDEALVGLRFLMAVQDPDGSVPHKVTALRHAALMMPAGDQDKRYLIGQDAATSFTFAAALAQAARVLAPYESQLPGLADSCLAAAGRAWTWAMAHSDVHFRNPGDVHTGEYKDDFIDDQRAWAALELWLSSGDDAYRQPEKLLAVVQNRNPFHGDASWKAMLTLALHTDRLNAAERKQWAEQLKWRSSRMKEYARFNPYHIPLGFNEYDFNWGSNAIHARQGLWYALTARMAAQPDWWTEAGRVGDYTLGMNPLDLCFVTGIGERSPVDIHHRPSKADGVAEPVPGFVAGGPQVVVKQQDCPSYPSDLPAMHYLDAWCSYTTNEIAINWNSNVMLLMACLATAGLEDE